MFQGASTPTTIADVSSTPETTGSITSSVPLPSSETQRTLISTEFESTTSLTYVHSTEKSSSLTTTIILTPDHTTNYQSTSLPEISSETSSDLTSTFHDFSTTRPETDVSQTLAPTEISTEGITTTGATTEVSTEATTQISTASATETTMEVTTEITTDATTEITTEASIASTSGATTQFTSAATTETTTEVTTESTTTVEETTDVTSTQVPTTGAETSAETTTTEVFVQWGDWGQWSEWTPTCYDDSADSIYKDSSKYYPKRSRTRDCIRTENGVNNVTVPVNDESGNCPFKDKLEKEKDEYHATGRFQYLTS